ncbi:MAG TPA: hypothetical protein VFN43_04310, partial [Humibacillus sp.]|nr:hypothetical protein [Humibacillus sp.]
MPERLDLEDELVALGRTLVTDPPSEDLAALVLARVAPGGANAPVGPASEIADVVRLPGPSRATPRRLGWAVAAAVVLVLALIPPVRAAVVELLRIGGIVVREVPPPSGPVTTPPATGAGTGAGPGAEGVAVSLERAEQLIGADIVLPTSLGPPTSVVVTHEGRVAEVTWAGPGGPGVVAGPTRLDVFVGSLSWGFLKTVWQAVTPVSVSGHDGVWLGANH